MTFSITTLCHYAKYHYAEYRYAEYHYAECRVFHYYAECRVLHFYAECHYAESRGALITMVEKVLLNRQQQRQR